MPEYRASSIRKDTGHDIILGVAFNDSFDSSFLIKKSCNQQPLFWAFLGGMYHVPRPTNIEMMNHQNLMCKKSPTTFTKTCLGPACHGIFASNFENAFSRHCVQSFIKRYITLSWVIGFEIMIHQRGSKHIANPVC